MNLSMTSHGDLVTLQMIYAGSLVGFEAFTALKLAAILPNKALRMSPTLKNNKLIWRQISSCFHTNIEPVL
jgi:hypothetical protein